MQSIMGEEEFEFLKTLLSNVAEKDTENIDKNTDIWRDLQLTSWDFDDVLGSITKKYGTDFSSMGKISDYVPNDPGEIFGGLLRTIRRKKYKPCRVEDLIIAIENGRWTKS